MSLTKMILAGVMACTTLIIPPAAAALAPPSSQSKMLSELDAIAHTFRVKYAPLEWAKEHANWDLDTEIGKAKTAVAANSKISIKEFQKTLRRFFHSTHDYHVNVYFFSTEAAFLPFRVKKAEGRYFLVWIDGSEAPTDWSIGDEVLEFDGKPIQQAITELKARELGNPSSLTDQALAEIYLTARVGAVGHVVPKGKINVVVKHQDNSISTDTLSWVYLPEEISSGPYRAAALSSIGRQEANHSSLINSALPRRMEALFHPIIKKSFTRCYRDAVKADAAEALGDKEGFLPTLGKITWRAPAKDYFYAYIFKTSSGKSVGYIRIHQYAGDAAEVKQFSQYIKMFQTKTDALVIDQTNNPGGDAFFMYALVSHLSSKPLTVPSHRVAINQEDVYTALQVLEIGSMEGALAQAMGEPMSEESIGKNREQEDSSLSGYPITQELVTGITDYMQFIISEWNKGNTLTDSIPLYGVNPLVVAPSVYTKPILVLVNELAISCGDFFPAILQDNQRATVMGTTTAGAGGFVVNSSFQNYFGMMGYSYTGSIAERSNHQPIESLGITPDIWYDVTANDLQNEYADYAAAILKVLDSMIKKN